MVLAVRLLAGTLLIAHGVVHLLYLADDVPEFSLADSWAVPGSIRHSVGLALLAATVATFALLGLAVWGVPGLSASWAVLAIAASAASLALLIAFWNVHLVLGVMIDAGVVVVAVTRPDWTHHLG